MRVTDGHIAFFSWFVIYTDSEHLMGPLFTNRPRDRYRLQAGKFLWINRQTSKEEQWKNKLFKQKSMTIWAKNFVELRRQKDLYTYKKVSG